MKPHKFYICESALVELYGKKVRVPTSKPRFFQAMGNSRDSASLKARHQAQVSGIQSPLFV